MKKIKTMKETIVSTQKIGDIILIFTQHSIYVSGRKKDIDNFVKKKV